jgi:hypothetical protein
LESLDIIQLLGCFIVILQNGNIGKKNHKQEKNTQAY